MIESSTQRIDRGGRDLLRRPLFKEFQLSAAVIYFSHILAGVYDRG